MHAGIVLNTSYIPSAQVIILPPSQPQRSPLLPLACLTQAVLELGGQVLQCYTTQPPTPAAPHQPPRSRPTPLTFTHSPRKYSDSEARCSKWLAWSNTSSAARQMPSTAGRNMKGSGKVREAARLVRAWSNTSSGAQQVPRTAQGEGEQGARSGQLPSKQRGRCPGLR